MADLGWISAEGTERLNFFIKSKKILEYFHDIQKYIIDSKALQILEQASEIITKLVNKKMNSQKNTLNTLNKDSD